MESSFLTLVGPTITSPPPPQPTSEAYEHKLKSGTGREKKLLPAVVGLPKTLVYRCWGAWGREKKLLYYPEEVPYSCLCWFFNGPN